jgi:hypothetical protein
MPWQFAPTRVPRQSYDYMLRNACGTTSLVAAAYDVLNVKDTRHEGLLSASPWLRGLATLCLARHTSRN